MIVHVQIYTVRQCTVTVQTVTTASDTCSIILVSSGGFIIDDEITDLFTQY